MKHRVVDLLLLLLIAVGGFLAWQTERKRSRLHAEYARLSQITGDLPVVDPSKVCLQALKTGDKTQFAWRVYYPPNYAQKLTHNSGGSVHSTSSGSSEFIGRVIFRQDKTGILHIYTRFSGGSTRVSVGDQELARLLHDRWNEIRVEQLGADKTATIDPAQSASLLRLTLPSDLEAATKNKLPRPLEKSDRPVLYELWLGPRTSQP